MANSDDPPFLNVGTEVSAKYRGAFCEATIKVAKKLVKCKVSYTHGQTDTVPNDIIKGPLKVNANVEVRQPDGQYLPGTLLRLVDSSTYTVVFDDGDEKTLKRSSLCLKGARHYSASESLDQMPLTDPENFGTPVHHQTKRGNRRRQQPSSSPDPAEVPSPPKKPAVTQSTEFPVGRCVFLENDRRRSSWLPAVVVPHHYVMEESEVTEDTICIRSFKDGRFFAAKVDELHSFSPDKEPLSSMLEGEVQPMYMCKPAIERAMAYLDTGDLPWDMDLLDSKETNNSTHKEDQSLAVDQSAERDNFNERLKKFQEEKGITLPQQPSVVQQELDLFKLYRLVRENGGMERVTQEFKWRSLYLQLRLPPTTNSSNMIKQAYKRHLYAFETYERAKEEGKNPVIKNTRKRPAVPDSDDDLDKTQAIKQEKLEPPETHTHTSPNTGPIPIQSDSMSQGEPTTSASTDKVEESRGGVAESIKANDRIKVLYGRGKTLQTYEAKVLEVDEALGQFYVHYNGWNTRYDEWIERERIVEKVTTPSKGLVRPPYAKKKQSKLKTKPKENGHSPIGRKQSPVSQETTPLTTPINTSNKTEKRGVGKPSRRRTSSTTETSSSCDIPSSPPLLSAPPPSSTSNNNKKKQTSSPPLSPPPLPSSSSPLQVTSVDEAVPLKVIENNQSDHDTTSSEDEHSFDIKKEENMEWLDLESDNNELVESTTTPPLPPPTTTASTTVTTALSPSQPDPLIISTQEQEEQSTQQSLSPRDSSQLDIVQSSSPPPTTTDNDKEVTLKEEDTNNDNKLSPTNTMLPSPGRVSSSSSSNRKNDSGVENSSESDGGGSGAGGTSSQLTDQREDLDFSIDMSIYTHLSPSEKISLIQDRMKAIQQKYMELKSEVTYLDRKKRKARKKEREVARLLALKEESNSELPIPPPSLPLAPLPSSSISVAVESA